MFEADCKRFGVQYISPKSKTDKEPVTEKRQRRKAIRSAFPKEYHHEKKTKQKAKRKERKWNVNDYLCRYCKAILVGKWRALYKSCTCDRPPPKSTFQVTGQAGSPVYSKGSIMRCAEYIIEDKNLISEDQFSSQEFLHPVLYEDQDSGSSSHLLTFDFKKGFVASNGRRCKTTDVLTAEIHINNSLFMKVGDCKRT